MHPPDLRCMAVSFRTRLFTLCKIQLACEVSPSVMCKKERAFDHKHAARTYLQSHPNAKVPKLSLLSVSGRYRTRLGGADLLRTGYCRDNAGEGASTRSIGRPDGRMVHAQLAAPRAALRQAALEELSELAPSLLMQHAPAIAARLEDRQMSVRRAALHALRRLPAAALFDYLPAILERLEDKDDEVRDSAHRRSPRAAGLGLGAAALVGTADAHRLEDSDASVRAIAVQALREGAALERLAPVLVRNLRRGRWVVRQGALEALAALTPMALASHMHEVACSMYIPMSPLSLSYISPISHMHEVACCMADTRTPRYGSRRWRPSNNLSRSIWRRSHLAPRSSSTRPTR